MSNLSNLNPLDGRYAEVAKPLGVFFSEKSLMQYRLLVKTEYFIALSENSKIKLRKFSSREKALIRKITEISISDAQIIKNIETKGYKNIKATNHDVKAIEYYLKEKLKRTSLKDSLEYIHFALTSEDINSVAYGLMLSDGLSGVIVPTLEKIFNDLKGFSRKYANTPMLARTHGQTASPTTVGKEFNVFAERLKRQINQLDNFELLVKLNGATGNYNAHQVAYPKVDWEKFTIKFIQKFNKRRKIRVRSNLVTTQIEPHDTYAELFDSLRRINVILIDLSQDTWRYISDGWFTQKTRSGEIGSSTMPHKVNPIDFENAEGNLGMANSLFTFFSTKLPISRLQRDLSDSTVQRNIGVSLGYSLIAYKSLLKGLGKISINKVKITEDLDNSLEILAEAIQTILRREGVKMPYEELKKLTRGKRVSRKDYNLFIDGLDISDKVKKELKRITPKNYIGLAKKLAKIS